MFALRKKTLSFEQHNIQYANDCEKYRLAQVDTCRYKQVGPNECVKFRFKILSGC